MLDPHLTIEEITLILNKINDGKFGYSEDPAVRRLQSKLSVALEVKRAAEERRAGR